MKFEVQSAGHEPFRLRNIYFQFCYSHLLKVISLLIFFLLFSSTSFAGFAFGGALGGIHTHEEHQFAYEGFIYLKVDQQVMLGLKSGQQNDDIPIAGSLLMRLPVGRIIMPFVTGDIGVVTRKEPYFFWKGGGGLDWKNGNLSSILIYGGFEKFENAVGLYSRIGLLLEF